MSVASARRLLVPVGESVTVRNTVAYVVREVDEADDPDADAGTGTTGERELHFVFPVAWQNRDLNAAEADEAEELLDRVRTWVREDFDLGEDEELPVEVTTAVIGAGEYLFSPRDYAATLLEYAREHGIGHIVLDPEFKPGARAPLLAPLEAELDLAEDVTYEQSPVERPVRRRRLLGRTTDLGAVATVFGACFLFYQILGGFAGTFDYATGAVSAAIAAAVFSGITFGRGIQPGRALRSAGRCLVYIPYLFWEIAKANIQVVYVVLHPSMPIDPSIETFRPAVPVGLPVTALANSITLTPGTVTVDIREQQFYVHALTQSARDGLYSGGLERGIRFVFFGRDAARVPSPRERGQAEERDPDGADHDAGRTGEPEPGDDGGGAE